MPIPVPPDDDVLLLLQAVWDQLLEGEHWPRQRVVDRLLYVRHGLDIDVVRRRTPDSLLVGGRPQGGAEPNPDEQLRLTIAGASACAGTEQIVQDFLRAVQVAGERELEHSDGNLAPALIANDVIEGASDGVGPGSPDARHPARQLGLLLMHEPWSDGGTLYAGGWSIQINRRIRRFRDVRSLGEYWDTRERLAPISSVPRGVRLTSSSMSHQRSLDKLRQLHEEANSPEVRRGGPAHAAWKAKVEAIMAASLAPESGTLQSFKNVSYSVGFWTGSPGEAERDAEYFSNQVERARALVEAAIFELELQEVEDPELTPNQPPATGDAPIFVVHGREDAKKYELLRLLDRTSDRDVRVLHEQPNGGATVLEKLERHVQAAGYAVVLLTADDEGRLRGEDSTPLMLRGRQNVIFELGVFIGALGRSKVAVLLEHGVEQPSDLGGLVYIPLDSAGAWRVALLKELENAGVAVDFKRIP